jgi:hypothetical protein
MKKYAGLALVWGWFFAFQGPYNDEGAMSRTVIGPFATEQECRAELATLTDTAKSMGLEIKISKCAYKQES